MAATIAQMHQDDLRIMIADIVKKVIRNELRALLEDPDDASELHDTIAERLRYQAGLVATGERGQLLDDLENQLGLDCYELSNQRA